MLAVLDKSEQLMYNYIKLWNGVSWQWPEQTLGINFLLGYIMKTGRYFYITISTRGLVLPINLIVGPTAGCRLRRMMKPKPRVAGP
jgi:hypothetical protein